MIDDKLFMSFDPNTIQHLGIKMYSNLPAAIAELVANSYDADARKVEIDLIGSEQIQKLLIIQMLMTARLEKVSNRKKYVRGRKTYPKFL